MPPPSSGGVHIVQILNTLEGFPSGLLGQNGADTVHLIVGALHADNMCAGMRGLRRGAREGRCSG